MSVQRGGTLLSFNNFVRRTLYFLIGFVSLVFGIIGIFVPILPTTPFLLLSAWCFLRSSKKFYNWLLNHKVLGFYVKNYLVHRGTTRKAKIYTLVFLWLVILISTVFFVQTLWLRTLLLVIACLVSIHVVTLRDIEK
ncbi:YbaN family protein [Fervidobacterium thailandense]|uniref:DUF454 domain-containing protein n=1 Tax=Fervidobacterium thailandense TaxID=1008305 RepID=A0A1E3G153_9BACT|nr:hypothetical protein A4H02_07850 [Fervidobacterium thailandense]